MNQETTPKEKRKISAKQLIIIVSALLVACGIILTVGYFLTLDEFDEKEMDKIGDEISRVRHFVSDWYAEIAASGVGDCTVFFNEIRFAGGRYSLAMAGGRIRAVYPRGERFFKLEYISRAEFFEIDGKVRCRLYYGNTGEYTFSV